MILGIPKTESDRILSLFRTAPRGTEVLVFGSRAKGNFREGSDIDLVVKGTGFTLEDRDR